MSRPPQNLLQDFDAWAVVAAQMVMRSPAERLEILQELQLVNAWDEAEAKWSARMAAGIAADDMALADRYGQLCAEAIGSRGSPDAAPEAPPLPLAERLAYSPRVVRAPLSGQQATVSVRPEVVDVAVGRGRTLTSPREAVPSATPFDARAAAAPAVPIPAAAAGGSVGSGTRSLSAGVMAEQTGAANRFDSPASQLPQLTVQQYAKLCARVSEQPDQVATIYAEVGIVDESMGAELHEGWRQHLAGDGESKKLFDMLYAHLRDQLRTRKA